jgi:hypothetical protein
MSYLEKKMTDSAMRIFLEQKAKSNSCKKQRKAE